MGPPKRQNTVRGHPFPRKWRWTALRLPPRQLKFSYAKVLRREQCRKHAILQKKVSSFGRTPHLAFSRDRLQRGHQRPLLGRLHEHVGHLPLKSLHRFPAQGRLHGVGEQPVRRGLL